jgi:hypothetical protein
MKVAATTNGTRFTAVSISVALSETAPVGIRPQRKPQRTWKEAVREVQAAWTPINQSGSGARLVEPFRGV